MGAGGWEELFRIYQVKLSLPRNMFAAGTGCSRFRWAHIAAHDCELLAVWSCGRGTKTTFATKQGTCAARHVWNLYKQRTSSQSSVCQCWLAREELLTTRVASQTFTHVLWEAETTNAFVSERLSLESGMFAHLWCRQLFCLCAVKFHFLVCTTGEYS